jgi:hypothetical protein
MDELASGVGVQLKIVFNVHHCYVLVHSPLKFIRGFVVSYVDYALPLPPFKTKGSKKE